MTDVRGWEHEPLDDLKNHPEVKTHLESHPLNWQDAHLLGLHYTSKGICPGDFIGVVWIGKKGSRAELHVRSKFPQMDYIKMFAECCAHPDIGSRMNKCFYCWPDEDYIDASNSPDFLPVIIISFLHELNQLCIRHLRKNFERRRENFIGKVKGKILVSENLRQNIVRGRLDRMFCEYQSFSDDILENRILRAALEWAARYVARDHSAKKHSKLLRRWIHACRSHLQGVSVTHISRPQFAAARKRGVFEFYRRPLHLAKAVLLNLGFNPHKEIPRGMDMKTPPYAIDSAELFERYAELKLRKKFSTVKFNHLISGGGDHPVSVKPDFYVPKGEEMPHIIDAKYKHLPDNEKLINSDIYQVIAYSEHQEMLKELKCSKDDVVRLSLVYPLIDDSEQEDGSKQSPIVEHRTIKSFLTDVYINKIRCPAIKKESEPPHP